MQTIYLDISNKGVVPCIYAKQGDARRFFRVFITDSGVPYPVPEEATVSVWYAGDSGAGNYTKIEDTNAVTVSGNEVWVEMVSQMVAVGGEGVMCLVAEVDGGQIGTWNIPYQVEYVPGAGSEVAGEYYPAFDERIKKVVGGMPLVKTVNGKAPDENGNVEVAGGGGSVPPTDELVQAVIDALPVYDGSYTEIFDSPLPTEIATEEEMTALLDTAEVGSVYKYTGETDTFENGALYVVEESE